jgi:hypothetical protein
METVKEIYTFKYEGDLEYIDISTFITSQLHFTNIINEVKYEIFPDQKLDIKIKPMPKGSWQMELMMLLSPFDANTLFTPEIVLSSLSLITATVIGIIKIRVALKGKKPEKIIDQGNDNITIQIADNVTINTTKQIYNIYSNNLSIDTSLKKTFEVIGNDEEINGIQLLDNKEKELLYIERPQFKYIEADNEIYEENSQKELIKNAALRIFKVVFGGDYKWQFYYQGHKISADIQHEQFLKRVESGEEGFNSGDQIIVDLEISKIFDKRVDSYINKSYTILQVHQHIKRSNQTKLDFENDEKLIQ